MEYGLGSDLTAPATYVLVIDDERLIADTLVHILRDAGFAASAAYDGESALESARLVPPEVVIADIRLPGMNGIDAAIAIEQSVPDAKALLLSAQGDLADLSRARQLGHNFLMVAKPVSPVELLQLVRNLARIQTHDLQKGSLRDDDR